jgi:hypothetical protein
MKVGACLVIYSLVACGDGSQIPETDAGSVDTAADDATPDAIVTDAHQDSAPLCFTYRYHQCNDTLIEVCVPYAGCGFVECDGETYGYCSPGTP